MNRYILAITGATGQVIGLKLLKALAEFNHVHLVISESAKSIIQDETDAVINENFAESVAGNERSGNIILHDNDDLYAPIASGSFRTDGMFVVPCPMNTLSAISSGHASNLIERAADVTIKERRRLVISPREMPFSPIHLENMLKLSRIGVTIAAPVPGFYNRPSSIEDMTDFIVGKILDCMGIDNKMYKRWGGD